MQKLLRQIFTRFVKFGYEEALVHVFDGIKICDLVNSDRNEEEIWSSYITEALELIQKHDARRYQRIQRYVRYVINHACIGWGQYESFILACKIDFAKYRHIQDRDWRVLMLARMLVHEATHGAVPFSKFRKGLESRLRVERLCYREEVRFTRRVRPDLELPDFDDSGHRKMYSQSVWRRLRMSIRLWQQGMGWGRNIS